jgi:hypothetical protein
VNNVQLTQHIVLIEERLTALDLVAQRLDAIDHRLADRVPVADIQQAIEETSATAEAVAELASSAPEVAQQLSSIVTTLGEQLPGTEMRDQLHNELSFVRQLISVMQGTRDEVLAMRVTVRGLSALLEQVLRARVADEEWEQGGRDRRSSDRRRAG